MEGIPRLAGVLLTLLVLASTPPAAADAGPIPTVGENEEGGGACVTPGDPPKSAPDVQLSNCGPRIIVRLITPDDVTELDVGPCRVNCAFTLTIELTVCVSPERMFNDPDTMDDAIAQIIVGPFTSSSETSSHSEFRLFRFDGGCN